MSRIPFAPKEKQTDATQHILESLKAKIGRVPHIFQHMANSENTLKGYLALNELVEKTTLSPQTKEKIALLIAQENECDYCLAAHSQIAKQHHLKDEEIIAARKGTCNDKKVAAILSFCKSCIQKSGKVEEKEVRTLQAAGVSDQEICDIILIITLNIFTNYFNNIVRCDVDFPKALPLT